MGSESLKDQEKRDLFFFLEKRKNLVENKQDLFFPSVLQGKKFTSSNFQTDKLFLPSSEEKTV